MVSSERPSKSDVNFPMTKATSNPGSSPTSNPDPDDHSVKGDKKKKSIIPKIFSSKQKGRESSEEDTSLSDENDHHHDLPKITPRMAFPESSSTKFQSSFTSERSHSSARIEGLNLSNFDRSMAPPATIVQDIRMFVATWNVGGNAPNHGLNLEDFLQVEGSADIYVLGFQEIVPLSAGNVLVIEDNEPAARWLALISFALNKPYHESVSSSNSKHSHNSKESKSNSNFFHKPSLKVLSKNIRADNSLLKACNCDVESSCSDRTRPRKLSDPSAYPSHLADSSPDNSTASVGEISSPGKLNYHLIASKQMVGLFLTVWARKDLVRHIGHLRMDCVGRGIMGRLGNKGCISISLTLHQTSFCFVCSHLASGEKEGDELRRNADVAEILKSTQFAKVCKNSCRRIPLPDRINGHDRIIWLGDLNYRVSLSYEETRHLLEDNDWNALLEKDQLNLERGAGRVFSGFREGKIYFAPTYKYSHNSDSYAGETVKSKKKRRTPAWCDRILWRGRGIEQLSYIRGESRFSDHRPVCAVFAVEVEMKSKNSKFRKGFSSCTATTKFDFHERLPSSHSFVYEF